MNTSTAEIRQARKEDQATIYDLLKKLLEDQSEILGEADETFRDLLTGSRGEILVAVEDGRVVGAITFSFNIALRYAGEYAQIEELIVDDSQRGKGTGARLVRASIDAAKARGCKEMGLYAMDHTRAFYEKIGFERAGTELRMPL